MKLLTKETKRYIILALVFLFLIKVLSCSIVPQTDKHAEQRCKPMNSKKQITLSETEEFLDLWSEYINKGYDKAVSDKISLMDGDIESNIPISLQLWFNNKCWTADRFYYVEDRLKAAIRTLYLKRHAENILEILNEQKNEDNAEQYDQMIEMQNKIANIENISELELDFVKKLEDQIVSTLNIK